MIRKPILLVAVVALFVSLINFTRAGASTPTPATVPVYYVDGSTVANAHIVIGQIPILAGGGPGVSSATEEFPVTLSNAAAFTSGDSYRCFASKPFGAGLLNGGLFRNIDGSHFVFRTARLGPAWQQDFFCIGN